ncbi:MAG: hypothetical protein V6004_00665 [Candidatus Dasytiphilus stammeri]
MNKKFVNATIKIFRVIGGEIGNLFSDRLKIFFLKGLKRFLYKNFSPQNMFFIILDIFQNFNF